MTFEDIQADFSLLEDWEDKYRYVIELGRDLEPLTPEEHNDANKVHGCVSQVWLVMTPKPGEDGKLRLYFRGDSDAHIVRGLIAILLALYSGKTAEEILAFDALSALGALGLEDHLTPQRSNGLKSMVERIRAEARTVLEEGAGKTADG